MNGNEGTPENSGREPGRTADAGSEADRREEHELEQSSDSPGTGPIAHDDAAPIVDFGSGAAASAPSDSASADGDRAHAEDATQRLDSWSLDTTREHGDSSASAGSRASDETSVLGEPSDLGSLFDAEPTDSEPTSAPSAEPGAIDPTPARRDAAEQGVDGASTDGHPDGAPVFGVPTAAAASTAAFGAVHSAVPGAEPAASGTTEAAPADAAGRSGAPRAEEIAGAAAAPRRKKWFEKPAIMIPAIIGVIAVVGAAIAVPLAIHNSNVTRGNELAAEFQTALDAHNTTWTPERLDQVDAAKISPALQDTFDFNSQNAAAMTDFATRCGAVTTASGIVVELAAAPVPELAVADGADASDAYVAARAQSDSLADLRTNAADFQSNVDAEMADLSTFCQTFPKYNSLANALADAINTKLKPTLVTPNGGEQTLPNNLVVKCSEAQGCPDLYDKDKRTAYADAIDASFTTYYSAMATLASTECWLPEFGPVCQTMATEYQKASAAWKAHTDDLRAGEPTVAAGSALYPNYAPTKQAALKATADADAAIQQAWWTVDPTVNGQTQQGWQSASLRGILGAHEQRIQELVAGVRQ